MEQENQNTTNVEFGANSCAENNLSQEMSEMKISHQTSNKEKDRSTEYESEEWIWAIPEDENPILDNGGKWMIFLKNSEHDLSTDMSSRLLRSWPSVVQLVRDGVLVNAKHLLSSLSNVTDVAIFYTKDSRDKTDLRRSAVAIRSAVPLEKDMFYKTNKASKSGLYKHEGHKAICLYWYNRQNVFFERSLYKLWRIVGIDKEKMLRSMPIPSKTTGVDWLWANAIGEVYREYNFNKNGGKWILPLDDRYKNNSGFTRLDSAWQSIYELVLDGVIRAAQCSTVDRSYEHDRGVILCYSDDCCNKRELKRVAESIRLAVYMDKLLYFKTNQATSMHHAKWYGSRFIYLYRHDPEGEMCEMPHGQWIPVEDLY